MIPVGNLEQFWSSIFYSEITTLFHLLLFLSGDYFEAQVSEFGSAT